MNAQLGPRSFDNYFEIEVKKYIQVQHNDFTINFTLLLNFKESFRLNYLNLTEKVADFSEQRSRRFSSAAVLMETIANAYEKITMR